MTESVSDLSVEDAYKNQAIEELQPLLTVFEVEYQGTQEPVKEGIPLNVSIDMLSNKLQKCWVAFEKIECWMKDNPRFNVTNHDGVVELLNNVDYSISQLKTQYRDQLRQLKRNEKSNQDSMFIAIVDTETTGLAEEDEVISVGIILLEISANSGKLIREIDSYYGLREPSVPIHPMAKKVHGLSLNDLIGKRLDMVRLAAMFEQADIIAAHNAQFDYKMLTKIYHPLIYATWGCTCLGLRDFWRKMPNRKLDTICAALGVNRPEPHNAMSDCRALIEVLVKSKSDYPTGTPYMWNLINRPWMPYPD
jgi:DNA polymerase III epsilon subunit-like protein